MSIKIEDPHSNDRITARFEDTHITPDDSVGIDVIHKGASGNIDICIYDNSSIQTTGDAAFGVRPWRTTGEGDIRIVMDSGAIRTADSGSAGIYPSHNGTGNIDIYVRGGAEINTKGYGANGTWVYHAGNGDILTDIQDSDIDTQFDPASGSSYAHAVGSYHTGTGNSRIDVTGGTIDTAGRSAYAVTGQSTGTGNIDIYVRGGAEINTKGRSANGTLAYHAGNGDILIDIQDSDIDTQFDPASGSSYAHAVRSYHTGTGNSRIDVTGGTIDTAGDYAHGIYALHTSGKGAIPVALDKTKIDAAGDGSSGVRVGTFNSADDDVSDGTMEHVSDFFDDDGYRRQTVTVRGESSVIGGSGDAAGIYLVGGGKVVVSWVLLSRWAPRVGAESGIAILAAP